MSDDILTRQSPILPLHITEIRLVTLQELKQALEEGQTETALDLVRAALVEGIAQIAWRNRYVVTKYVVTPEGVEEDPISHAWLDPKGGVGINIKHVAESVRKLTPSSPASGPEMPQEAAQPPTTSEESLVPNLDELGDERRSSIAPTSAPKKKGKK